MNSEMKLRLELMEMTLTLREKHHARAPSRREYEQHMLCHMRHSAWCPWCATGRGLDDQHRREQGRGVPAVPTVDMEFRHTGELSAASLCLKCSVSGIIGAHAVT